MRAPLRFSILALAAAAALFAGCRRDEEPEELLAYVPADTPYVFANLEPIPRAQIDAMAEKMAPIAELYRSMIDDALADIAAKPAASTGDKAARAVLEELRGKLSLEGIESIGFDRQVRSAIYGVGLVPVARMALRDGEALRAFVARVEERAGEKLPVAKVGDREYWRVQTPEGKLAAVIAVTPRWLTVSLVPAQAEPALIERVLGVELPDDDLADAGAIEKLNADYGFLPYGSGYVDFGALVERLSARDPADTAFTAALGMSADVTPQCATELGGLAKQAPRLVTGYDAFEVARMDSRIVLELDAATTAALAKLAVPVPGLGGDADSLFDFGMSLKLEPLMAFVNEKAAAVASAPFQCESLATLNEGVASMRTQLSNPAVFAAAPVLQGFHVALTRFEMPGGENPAPTAEGSIVIASENPQSLVAMAKSFVPTIATLDLAADGTAVALPEGTLPAGTPPAYVALGDKAIALGVGAQAQTAVSAALKAPSANPPPLMEMEYAGRMFAQFMDQALAQGATDEAQSEAERAETERAVRVMKAIYGEFIERVGFSIGVGKTGLEVRQTMRMKA